MTPEELLPIVRRIATLNGVDPDLVMRVIQAESNYDPLAVSPVGAQGLMQLMPATAEELGVTDPHDPEQNIMGGTKYLAQLIAQFGAPTPTNRNALAAWNFGPGNVNKGLPWPEETVNFTNKIIPEAAPVPEKTTLSPGTETAFRRWYGERARQFKMHPDPDNAGHQYDYRAAYMAGVGPDPQGKWDEKFKLPGHPAASSLMPGPAPATAEEDLQAKKLRITSDPDFKNFDAATQARILGRLVSGKAAVETLLTPKPGPMGTLQKIADLLKPISAVSPLASVDQVKDRALGLLSGAVGIGESALGLGDIVSGGAAGQAANAAGFDPGRTKEILSRYLSPEAQAGNAAVQDADGFVDTAIAALQNPSTIVQATVESLPLLLPSGMAGRGLAAGAKYLPKAVGAALKNWAPAIGEGLVGTGSAAEQIRQGTPGGELTLGGTAAALGTGAAITGIGRLGNRIAEELGIADIDTVLAGAARNAQAAHGLFKRVIYGAFQEGVLEEFGQSVVEQVLQNAALGRPLEEGVDQAGVLGMFSGGLMSAGTNLGATQTTDPNKLTSGLLDRSMTRARASAAAEPNFGVSPEAALDNPVNFMAQLRWLLGGGKPEDLPASITPDQATAIERMALAERGPVRGTFPTEPQPIPEPQDPRLVKTPQEAGVVRPAPQPLQAQPEVVEGPPVATPRGPEPAAPAPEPVVDEDAASLEYLRAEREKLRKELEAHDSEFPEFAQEPTAQPARPAPEPVMPADEEAARQNILAERERLKQQGVSPTAPTREPAPVPKPAPVPAPEPAPVPDRDFTVEEPAAAAPDPESWFATTAAAAKQPPVVRKVVDFVPDPSYTVESRRALPTDDVPDPTLRARVEDEAWKMSLMKPKEYSQHRIPDEMLPHSAVLLDLASELRSAHRMGKQDVAIDQDIFGEFVKGLEDGLYTVDSSDNNTVAERVLQIHGGRVVGGGLIIDGMTAGIHAGRGVGSPVSARPLYEYMRTKSKPDTTVSMAGELAARRHGRKVASGTTVEGTEGGREAGTSAPVADVREGAAGGPQEPVPASAGGTVQEAPGSDRPPELTSSAESLGSEAIQVGRIGGREYKTGDVVQEGPHKGKTVVSFEESGIPVLRRPSAAKVEPRATIPPEPAPASAAPVAPSRGKKKSADTIAGKTTAELDAATEARRQRHLAEAEAEAAPTPFVDPAVKVRTDVLKALKVNKPVETPPQAEAIESGKVSGLEASVAGLDELGAKDREYRDLLPKEQQYTALKKGETWRDRAVRLAKGESAVAEPVPTVAEPVKAPEPAKPPVNVLQKLKVRTPDTMRQEWEENGTVPLEFIADWKRNHGGNIPKVEQIPAGMDKWLAKIGAGRKQSKQGLLDKLKTLGKKEEPEEDSGFAKMEVSPGKAGMGSRDLPRMIKELGQNLYAGDLGTVIVKEGLQNSVDAIPVGTVGNISINVNTSDRTFTIIDDGIGMMPDVIKNQFLDPGGSYKPEGSAGGFGIAKIALFSNADVIDVTSVARNPKTGELIKSHLEGDADKWLDPDMKVEHEVVPEGTPTGTTAKIRLNSGAQLSRYSTSEWLTDFLKNQMTDHNFDFKVNGSPLKGARKATAIPIMEPFTKTDWYGFAGAEHFSNGDEPLIGSGDLMLNGKVNEVTVLADKNGIGVYGDSVENQHWIFNWPDNKEMLSAQQARNAINKLWQDDSFWSQYPEFGQKAAKSHDLVHTINNPGGDLEFWASPTYHDTNYVRVTVMNNGLPQLEEVIHLRESTKMPQEVRVNIKPKVDTTDGRYPFTPNRQQLRDWPKTAVVDFIKNDLYNQGIKKEQKLYQQAMDNRTTIPGSRLKLYETTGSVPKSVLDEMASSPVTSAIASAVDSVLNGAAKAVTESGLPDLGTEIRNFSAGLGFSAGRWYGINFDATKIFGKLPDARAPYGAKPTISADQKMYHILIDPWITIDRIPSDVSVQKQATMLGRNIWGTAVHELVHNMYRNHDTDAMGAITKWLPQTVAEGMRIIRKMEGELKRDPGFIDKLREQSLRLNNEFANGEGRDVLGPVAIESKPRGAGTGPQDGGEGRVPSGGVRAGRKWGRSVAARPTGLSMEKLDEAGNIVGKSVAAKPTGLEFKKPEKPSDNPIIAAHQNRHTTYKNEVQQHLLKSGIKRAPGESSHVLLYDGDTSTVEVFKMENGLYAYIIGQSGREAHFPVESGRLKADTLEKAQKEAIAKVGQYAEREDSVGVLARHDEWIEDPEGVQYGSFLDEPEQPGGAASPKGEGENKAVRRDGSPLKLYHATTKEFKDFNTGIIWAAESPEYAQDLKLSPRLKDDDMPEGANVRPLHFTVRNPLDLRETDLTKDMTLKEASAAVGFDIPEPAAENQLVAATKKAKMNPILRMLVSSMLKKRPLARWMAEPEFVEAAKAQGYDGIRAKEDGELTWAVFSKDQVRSALAPKYSVSKEPSLRDKKIAKDVAILKKAGYRLRVSESDILDEPKIIYAKGKDIWDEHYEAHEFPEELQDAVERINNHMRPPGDLPAVGVVSIHDGTIEATWTRDQTRYSYRHTDYMQDMGRRVNARDGDLIPFSVDKTGKVHVDTFWLEGLSESTPGWTHGVSMGMEPAEIWPQTKAMIDQFGGKEGLERHIESQLQQKKAKYSVQANELGFYSQLERALFRGKVVDSDKAPMNMTGAQWLEHIPTLKVKADEIHWSGLDDFLAERKDQRVTRDEILEHLKNNQFEVKEVTLAKGAVRPRGEPRVKDYAGRGYWIVEPDGQSPNDGSQIRIDKMGDGRYGVDVPYPADLSYYKRFWGDPETQVALHAEREEEPGWGVPQEADQYIKVFNKLPEAIEWAKSIEKKFFDGKESIAANPKAEAYSEPGGENYREVFITAPSGQKRPWAPRWDDVTPTSSMVRWSDGTQGSVFVDSRGKWTANMRDPGLSHKPNYIDLPPEINTLAKAKQHLISLASPDQMRPMKENWKDGHTAFYNDIENPVVRLRLKDRVTSDGKKSLFIEEIQEPAKGQPMPPELRKRAYEIGLRRALRMAVEGGYDQLSWTTGEMQAKRYSLEHQVDRIVWNKSRNLLWGVKDGQVVIDQTVTPDKLESYVGKEAAKKLMDESSRAKLKGSDAATQVQDVKEHLLPEEVDRSGHLIPDIRFIEGDDLKVGGEGLKNRYDRNVPRILEKEAAKWGAKVGESRFGNVDSLTWTETPPGDTNVPGAVADIPSPMGKLQAIIEHVDNSSDLGEQYEGFILSFKQGNRKPQYNNDLHGDNIQEAKLDAIRVLKDRGFINDYYPEMNTQSLDITPEMKKGVEFPQFATKRTAPMPSDGNEIYNGLFDPLDGHIEVTWSGEQVQGSMGRPRSHVNYMSPEQIEQYENGDLVAFFIGHDGKLEIEPAATARGGRVTFDENAMSRKLEKQLGMGRGYTQTADVGSVPEPITLESVKANLPEGLNQKVVEKDGNFVIPTDRGEILIHPTGDIDINWHALEEGHGAEAAAQVKAGLRQVVGDTVSIGRDSIVRIVDAGELPHEVGGHVFLDHFANPKEWKVIRRDLQKAADAEGKTVDEVFGDGFKDWFLHDREVRENETTIQRLYRRLYEFFASIRHQFNPTLESTYREVGRGRAFERPAREANGTAYDVVKFPKDRLPPGTVVRRMTDNDVKKMQYFAAGGEDFGPTDWVTVDKDGHILDHQNGSLNKAEATVKSIKSIERRGKKLEPGELSAKESQQEDDRLSREPGQWTHGSVTEGGPEGGTTTREFTNPALMYHAEPYMEKASGKTEYNIMDSKDKHVGTVEANSPEEAIQLFHKGRPEMRQALADYDAKQESAEVVSSTSHQFGLPEELRALESNVNSDVPVIGYELLHRYQDLIKQGKWTTAEKQELGLLKKGIEKVIGYPVEEIGPGQTTGEAEEAHLRKTFTPWEQGRYKKLYAELVQREGRMPKNKEEYKELDGYLERMNKYSYEPTRAALTQKNKDILRANHPIEYVERQAYEAHHPSEPVLIGDPIPLDDEPQVGYHYLDAEGKPTDDSPSAAFIVKVLEEGEASPGGVDAVLPAGSSKQDFDTVVKKLVQKNKFRKQTPDRSLGSGSTFDPADVERGPGEKNFKKALDLSKFDNPSIEASLKIMSSAAKEKLLKQLQSLPEKALSPQGKKLLSQLLREKGQSVLKVLKFRKSEEPE